LSQTLTTSLSDPPACPHWKWIEEPKFVFRGARIHCRRRLELKANHEIFTSSSSLAINNSIPYPSPSPRAVAVVMKAFLANSCVSSALLLFGCWIPIIFRTRTPRMTLSIASPTTGGMAAIQFTLTGLVLCVYHQLSCEGSQ